MQDGLPFFLMLADAEMSEVAVTSPSVSAPSNLSSIALWPFIALVASLIGSAAVAADNRHTQAVDVEDSGQVRFLAEEIDLEAYVTSTLADPQSYMPPLVIPPSDFSSDGAGSTYFFSFSGGFFGATGTGGCYMAPVYLPHGVTVSNFFAYLYDNTATTNISLALRRKFIHDLSATQIMGSVTSAGASTSIQVVGDESIDFPLTSSDYSYSVTGCMSEGSGNVLRIYGVRIFYVQP